MKQSVERIGFGAVGAVCGVSSAMQFCGWARAAMRFQGAKRKPARAAMRFRVRVASGHAIPCTLSGWVRAAKRFRAAKESYRYSFRACMHGYASYALSAVRGRSGCIEQCTSVYVHAAC